MKYLVKIVLILFVFNALFQSELSVIWFFRLWTVIFLLLILYIWWNDKKNFEKFVLFEFGLYNAIEEFTKDGSIVRKEHALVIIIVPFIWYLKKIFKK